MALLKVGVDAEAAPILDGEREVELPIQLVLAALSDAHDAKEQEPHICRGQRLQLQGPRGCVGVGGTPVVVVKPAAGRGWLGSGGLGRGERLWYCYCNF